MSDYKYLIKKIPVQNSLLLSNTVEEGYKNRAFLSNYLNAFSSHEFYLSRLGYFHWRSQKDVLERIKNYNIIFPKNENLNCEEAISKIHEIGLTHLLLSSNNNDKILTCKNWDQESKGDWTFINIE